MEKKVLLEVKNIHKAFGITKALNDVSFQIYAGEVRGLIGENGSGKSTVSSIISGIYKADHGGMLYQGKEYAPANILDANNHHICMIVQEQSTVAAISVAANLFIGKEHMFSRGGIVNRRKMEDAAQKALDEVGITHIRPGELTRYLSFEDRKLIEIARAFYMAPKLLIVDETTTALSRQGRDLLYSLMERLCQEGGSVLFISHDIDEVMEKSDAVTVLKDGNLTATLDKAEFSEKKIRNLMVGREISDDYYRTDFDCSYGKEVVLKADHITYGSLKDVTLELHKGEILGVGGLTDCGMHDLGRLMFGIVKPDEGRVIYREKELIASPNQAIGRRIGYLSKNRDTEALMTTMSIQDNICVSGYAKIEKRGIITSASEKEFSEKWAGVMNTKMSSVNAPVNSLSGGNKQKIVIAKWLANDTEVFIMDCPTRGIDVGVKAAIYRLMEKLKKEGKSILMISEELTELLGMSDRIIVLKNGVQAGEFKRNEVFTEQKLIEVMI